MEYGHEQAVADGVNVDFDIYKIRTKITAQGSTIEAAPGVTLALRERRTRRVRWEALMKTSATRLNSLTVMLLPRPDSSCYPHFQERLFTEIFPGPTHVPKTLIFAKDDSMLRTSSKWCGKNSERGMISAPRLPTRPRAKTHMTSPGVPHQLQSAHSSHCGHDCHWD